MVYTKEFKTNYQKNNCRRIEEMLKYTEILWWIEGNYQKNSTFYIHPLLGIFILNYSGHLHLKLFCKLYLKVDSALGNSNHFTWAR